MNSRTNTSEIRRRLNKARNKHCLFIVAIRSKRDSDELIPIAAGSLLRAAQLNKYVGRIVMDPMTRPNTHARAQPGTRIMANTLLIQTIYSQSHMESYCSQQTLSNRT